MNFNDNSYEENNIDFESALINACSFTDTGVVIKAEDTSVAIPPMCNPADSSNYFYYDMTDQYDIARCRYTCLLNIRH